MAYARVGSRRRDGHGRRQCRGRGRRLFGRARGGHYLGSDRAAQNRKQDNDPHGHAAGYG